MERVGKVRYQIIREIGLDSSGQRRGQNSRVYLADERSLGGQIAVKEIEKTAFPKPDDYFREAQKMFEVDSEHVVPVQYMCEQTDTVALVMKYFERGSLADKIEHGPIPPSEVVRIGQHVLSGIVRIHNAHTIHFDVKPSNVLFTNASVAMVADFGQARTVRPDGTVDWPGMYEYGLPPEWYSSSAGTSRSDIYQVGLTLYRAVNGDPFFRAQVPTTDRELETRTVAGKFPNRNKWLPHVPKQLRTVIRKALSLVPTDRYASPEEFQNDLSFRGNDWTTSIDLSSGETEWKTQPSGKAAMIVRLSRTKSGWAVSLYQDGAKRRRFRTPDWRDGLTPVQANRHLLELFRSLG
ncbi:MAG: serine/threonine-protein kinase [Planctomycetota bacterium]